MKGRHQLRRRFSLQPSFLEEEESGHERRQNASRSQCSEQNVPMEKVEKASPPASGTFRHKIVVMGAAKVGKSSIITQFLYGTFSAKYKPTIEEMHHSDFNVNGVHLTLDILDTAGSFEFPAMRTLSISSGDAFVLVYDVTDNSTFEEARTLRDQIHEVKCSTNVPIVIVGNKIDLIDNREVSDN
ncbi:hypothetical protein WA026_020061 [Henosepilachna vigintioctopunctata]|uniref:Uncharacterized protein n=1 Tax=Henosepilachna vigintioctopunctata TaxID=420089 RepID=A0AAW1U9Q1_9CUCU